MTSVIFTRRAMLSGGALMGLGTLLTACGQQANNEASASSSSTAAPSETASVSAAATDSPSATPSTVRGYSGGSKAPEGEYRPADKYGPAQNVPKPNAPEDGYNEKSLEGIHKTMDAGFCGVITAPKLAITRWLSSSCLPLSKVRSKPIQMSRNFTKAAAGLLVA